MEFPVFIVINVERTAVGYTMISAKYFCSNLAWCIQN